MLRRMLDHVLDRFATAPPVEQIVAAAASARDNLVVREARGGGVPALAAALARRTHRPMLLLTSSIERAEALTDGLQFFGAEPLILPNFETLPFEHAEPVMHIAASYNKVLDRLMHPAAGRGADHTQPVIVAPADAIMFRPLPADGLARQAVRIQWGQSLDLDDLSQQLIEMGYARESLVESPGEFAIRGSIIDIYPPEGDWPWRLELFGDDVEQIRQFDPSTQRSKPSDKEIELGEILAVACHQPRLDWLAQGKPLGSFFDLLPADTLVFVDGPGRLHQRMLRFDDVARSHWRDLMRANDSYKDNFFVRNEVQPEEWVLSSSAVHQALGRFQRVESMDLLGETDEPVEPNIDKQSLKIRPAAVHDDKKPGLSNAPEIHAKERLPKVRPPQPADTDQPSFGFAIGTQSFEKIPSQFPEYLGLFRERLRKGHWVLVVCDNNGQVMRLDELLRENDMSAVILNEQTSRAGLPNGPQDRCPDILLTAGELHEGFQCIDAGLMVVTDREIFGRYKRRHVYRKVYHGRPVANPAEIHRGDFVVHIEHGIGHFDGMRRQTVDGRLAEFLEISYQEGNKLLVPVEKLHLVQKYASADGKEPVLDKLGGKKWQSRRRKSMEAVRKMAGELLELYARRETAEGYPYSPDSTWQQEFEASFLYQETPDQLKAIAEVKNDMMKPRPMDRLVCGDVGYGKTEVAIRAAFKALVEKRQVALLAPTTLLVAQHYNTFKERFADYPFKVEMLSRFRTAQQQKEIIRELKEGEVHLIIGTHRLLSRDISFKDLGLLVVDEEQRFGVAQKEKIKSLRSAIDILTLTATPIPRTLYMALSGIRDLSIITTPPANRHPIKTRTIHWDREQMEEAILRELNRGGQVYFIHNRIQTIDEVADRVREIVPRARVVVAHGQMDEVILEKIMTDFINEQFDILISTTIIENGIDIPNVNTIIINRADAFGLAQLYQLRGRVGRDVRQAYAYLILPPGEAITPQAIKRLEALEEFTELGVGFSIAMRDMEIRGTGSILGGEQHGAITDIGFEMYCKLLEETVGEMRGMPPAEPLWPVEIKISADQFLPEDYIPIESQRIRFYKDLAGARTREDLEFLVDELVDRYGSMPPPSANLVNAARLKVAASSWRIDQIRLLGETVRVTCPMFTTELATRLAERAAAGRGVFARLVKQTGQIILHIKDTGEEIKSEEILEALANFFEALPTNEMSRTM